MKTEEQKKVYVCSPLSDPDPQKVEQNMTAARNYAAALQAEGYRAYAPHGYIPLLLMDSDPTERAIAMKLCLAILDICDELRVYGNRITKGMKEEISFTLSKKGKTIIVEPSLEEAYRELLASIDYSDAPFTPSA